MSTPPKQRNLWKNITWKDKDEKLAFFNHYFKHDDIVTDHQKTIIDAFKKRLIHFIEEGTIKTGGTERAPNIDDIIQKIKEE